MALQYHGIEMRFAALLLGLMILGGCDSAPEPAHSAARESAPPSQPASPRDNRADNRPVIVAFGDSLTAGFGADPGKSYPDFLQQDLDRRALRYRVVNAGISGETTTDALERLNTVIALKPVVVIVEFGGNDGLRGLPLSTTRANLDQIVQSLQNSGTQVLLAGMTLPPNYGPDYIAAFQNIFKDLAVKYKTPLIPFLLEGVAGTNRMQRDGLHATADGNRIVAGTVIKYLQPLLRRN